VNRSLGPSAERLEEMRRLEELVGPEFLSQGHNPIGFRKYRNTLKIEIPNMVARSWALAGPNL